MLRDNPLAALTRAHFEQPVVFTNTVLGTIAVVSDPSAVARVLVDNAANYRRERLQRRMMEVPFGASVLAAEGELWRSQRRCLAPAFTPKAVDGYAEGTARAARAVVDRWMNFADGPARAIDWELDRAMVDVVERTLYTDGLQRDPNDVTDNIRLHYALVARPSVLDVLDIPRWIPRLTRARHRPVHAFFAAMAQAMLDARLSRLSGGAGPPPDDLMALLVRHRADLSPPDVLANIFTIFAATEPVASTLIWALFLLSRTPEWREYLEAEVDRELGSDHDVEAWLPRLVATRAVIEETMRLYPAIATIHREAVEADELAGHVIAAGTIVVISPWVMHRHRLLWNQPEVFDPARFMPETRAGAARFAYLPFGTGPRTCIGGVFGLQIAIILLATIVRRFRLEVASDHEVRPVLRVSLRPRGGLPMTIHRR